MPETLEGATLKQLTLFAGDSLASLTVKPGSAEARQMTVTSGRNISELLTRCDPLGLLVKMCLTSEQLFSIKCYLTWKIWRTPQNRCVYLLAPLALTTSENESLFWLTPTAHDANAIKRSREGWLKRMEYRKSINRNTTPPGSLAEQVLLSDIAPVVNVTGDILHRIDRGGMLNPEWVEWLMGFPIGWTELEHSETP